jgi:DNA polymerase-3 subunit epsilon
VWERVAAPFIGGCPVVAHNAAFDMGVLRAALSWYGLAAEGLRYFCSLRIARTAWRELPSHALPSLAARFSIVYKAHDALDDARTCGDIVNRAAERFGCADLGGLLRRAGTGFRTL